MDQSTIEQLARKLAAADPEGAPYDSPTNQPGVDDNAEYWNEFATRLLAAGGVTLA